MKRFMQQAAVVLAVVAVLSIARDASAQGRRGFGGPFGLVGAEPIQDELKADAAQKEKINALVQAFNEEGQKKRDDAKIPGFMELFQLSQEEQDKAMAKMAEINDELIKTYRPKLDEILKKEQVTRLDQLVLQIAGANALTQKATAEKLKLTEEQTKKIAAVIDTYNKGVAEARQNMDFAKFGELTETRDKDALAVLTDDQKKTYEEMRGPAFDFSQLRQGGKGKGKGFGKGKGKG